jgi:hypothetical protein
MAELHADASHVLDTLVATNAFVHCLRLFMTMLHVQDRLWPILMGEASSFAWL